MTDDRVCDLKNGCTCVAPGVNGGFHFEGRDDCPHFHMPCPAIVQSKQDRVRMTRGAFDKKRDKMLREAERRIEKLKPQSETEEKLREIRHQPIKHLERKGLKVGRRARTR